MSTKTLQLIVKIEQNRIVELKRTIIEQENSLEGLDNRFQQAKETITQLEDKSIEITWSEEQKKKNEEK